MNEKKEYMTYMEKRARRRAFGDFQDLHGDGVDIRHLRGVSSRVRDSMNDCLYRDAFEFFGDKRHQLIGEIMEKGLTKKGAGRLAMIRLRKKEADCGRR